MKPDERERFEIFLKECEEFRASCQQRRKDFPVRVISEKVGEELSSKLLSDQSFAYEMLYSKVASLNAGAVMAFMFHWGVSKELADEALQKLASSPSQWDHEFETALIAKYYRYSQDPRVTDQLLRSRHEEKNNDRLQGWVDGALRAVSASQSDEDAWYGS